MRPDAAQTPRPSTFPGSPRRSNGLIGARPPWDLRAGGSIWSPQRARCRRGQELPDLIRRRTFSQRSSSLATTVSIGSAATETQNERWADSCTMDCTTDASLFVPFLLGAYRVSSRVLRLDMASPIAGDEPIALAGKLLYCSLRTPAAASCITA